MYLEVNSLQKNLILAQYKIAVNDWFFWLISTESVIMEQSW